MDGALVPSLLLLLPLVGAFGIVLGSPKQARWTALAASTLTLGYGIVLAVLDRSWTGGEFSLDATIPWLELLGVEIRLGADAVAMLLMLLTTLLMPLCILGSFTAITDRLKEYYGWMLVLQAAMTGVFLARDLIFFYTCFELTLVPMFFLIAIWGGENRSRASIKFFLYTFTGSLLTLAGVLYVAWRYSVDPLRPGGWTFDIATLTEFASNRLPAAEQGWVLLALMAGFAVKVPLFPVHTWLPLAHTEAPTAGSVILAGVLLKLGTYGLFRFVVPMVPAAVIHYGPAIAVLSIVGILYAALVCWVQSDIKKLIAYSSVSHLGFCVLGLMALNPLGLQGSVLYMLNHGLSTGALFFLVGMIYERYHTRDMSRLGGLVKSMPVWSFFMVFFVLSSVGLPGLNGFVGEFLCLIGAFTATRDALPYPGVLGPWYAAVAGIGMIFAAMYLLIMVGKVVFGPTREPHDAGHPSRRDALPRDLSVREIAILVPLAVLCLYVGFQPQPLTDALRGPVEQALAVYPSKLLRMETAEAKLLAPSGSTAGPEDRDG